MSDLNRPLIAEGSHTSDASTSAGPTPTPSHAPHAPHSQTLTSPPPNYAAPQQQYSHPQQQPYAQHQQRVQQQPQQYGQPQVYYAPPQQQVVYQTVPVAGPTVVVQQRGPCPAGGAHAIVEDFTACGLCLGICFFPLGLICCLTMTERSCTRCGQRFA